MNGDQFKGDKGEYMSKKIIGLVPLWDDYRQSIWMLPGYMDRITQAGGIPVILPLKGSEQDIKDAFALCDGLLMTGGHDVDPVLYGEEKKSVCGTICPERDRMEQIVYHMALEEDKPVLGICRGIQLINVLQGGTLYQDLCTEHGSTVSHHMERPYNAAAHEVTIKQNTPLYNLLGVDHLGVNSLHHQAIKELGKDLQVMAVAPDGIVEAVCHVQRSFIWGVQWHPEFTKWEDGPSKAVFTEFIRACR